MLAYFVIFIGAFLRVLPHPANFAPIGALALFGGVYLDKRVALWLPIAAMIVSDAFIGFDSIISRLTVYGAFLLIGLVGMWIRNHKNIFTIVAGSLSASVIFFLVTNFAFFYPLKMYDHNFAGIIAAYAAGVPFFRNTLFSDLVYTAVFFGSFELVQIFAKRRANVVYNKSQS
jgi:hypothetical protein